MSGAFWIWLGLSGAAAGWLLYQLPRQAPTRDLRALALLGFATLLTAGFFLGEQAARNEQARLRRMVEGLAPTYAAELFTFIFYLGLLSQIFAQEFTASVNETTVADNERFQVTFPFSGRSINNLAKFSPPTFENF